MHVGLRPFSELSKYSLYMNLVSLITLQCPLHLSMFSLLSTISSSLSAAAANCWEDILDWKLNRLTESRKVLINKILGMSFYIFAYH